MRSTTHSSSFTARQVPETGSVEPKPAGPHNGNCPPRGCPGSKDPSPAVGEATGERGQPSGSDRDPAPPIPRGDFLDGTLQFWRPRLSEELTREDARQIVENIVGFFSVLAEWSAAEDANRTFGDETAAPAPPKDPA